MNEEYLLKTIDAVISAKGFAHISSIKDAVFEDLKMALNQLVTEGRLSFQRDKNGNPIFSINGEVG